MESSFVPTKLTSNTIQKLRINQSNDDSQVKQLPPQKDMTMQKKMFGAIDINKLNFEFDRYFLNWLKQRKIGIVVCSYKSNALLSMGTVPNLETNKDMLSLWITNSLRPMGAFYDKSRDNLWVGNALQLCQYHNEGNRKSDRDTMPDFDSHFVPRTIRTVNDIDIHDICVDKFGKCFFVSALFCCVCEPCENGSFKVYWTPKWISKIAAEDRCHLNGLALRDDVPRYVTSVSRTDIRGGWREHKRDGGIVWDIVEDKLICKNLSMPHSPRYHNGKLWLLESGTGYFGYIDLATTVMDEKGDGKGEKEEYHPFIKKVFLPGYIRGISFVDKYAIIGSSQDRHEQTFQGLELRNTLESKGVSEAKCGLFIVNMETFDVIHQFEFKGDEIKEIYDVSIIPNVRRPIISEVDFQTLATEFNIINSLDKAISH